MRVEIVKTARGRGKEKTTSEPGHINKHPTHCLPCSGGQANKHRTEIRCISWAHNRPQDEYHRRHRDRRQDGGTAEDTNNKGTDVTEFLQRLHVFPVVYDADNHQYSDDYSQETGKVVPMPKTLFVNLIYVYSNIPLFSLSGSVVQNKLVNDHLCNI